MVRGTGFFLLVAVAVPVWTPATTAGQLPNCTIDFEVPDPDDTCPDDTPECGATFVGGDGCDVIGELMCYSSGFYSYQVAEGGALTITLSDDLNSLSVFFVHEVAGGAGTMTFLSATGQQVDDPLFTDGPCASGPMLPTHVLFFSQPVLSIEVANTGVGNLWIDTLEVNPSCGDGGDCDDGDACTTDACDGGACTHTPLDCDDSDPCTSDMCDTGNCTHTPMDCDDGIACTDDECDAGACVSTPDDSNCPDDGEFCNGIENCDPLLGCVSSGPPCQAGQFCNEATETCGECIADGDCDDGDASTNDACVDGTCVFIPSTGDCPADLDGDGDVGAFDLANLLGSWGPNVGHPADLTGDGSVGAEDLAILLGSWGPCPAPEPSECQNDEDCDDGDACTTDACDGMACTYTPVDCDDSDPCTSDSCDAGNCTHTPMDCDDGVACTDDACVAGACVSTPNDSNCPDDGEFCNGIENCDLLLGCGSSDDPCQAGQFCNEATETCDECIADGDCDDGDASTNDTCVDGTCVFIPPTGDEDDSMMDDEEMESNGCGAGSCGAAGGMSLAWIFAALSAARVARRRGWPVGKR
ncbi:MAG: hypothetical protein IID41_04205 [Planctomycetes bacterium]|nr:hypothetical protein [Planctomycetota bacterium]